MLLNNIRMYWKIAILAFGLVTFSLAIGGIIILGSMTRLQEEQFGQRLMITARTVANLPDIREAVINKSPGGDLSSTSENIRIINDVSYIVVLNMDKKRLTHPLKERIGEYLEDKDAEPAFAEHTYLSKVKGEVGTALRAYVPVMDDQHQQIGVVMAGKLMPSLGQMIWGQRGPFAATAVLSLGFGILGSWQLARHMKRQMYDLEPQEIARMFRERTAAFESMHEGAIAVDNSERISIFNDRAKQIFGISGDVVGRQIRDVLPDTRLPEILQLKKPIYNQELLVGNALIWSNRIPIRLKPGDPPIGALAIFQDRTDVTRMAEELTGVKAFVEALRVQNHEYMNKLHTIAGLIQLDQKEKALDYLFEVSEQQEELLTFLRGSFTDESIAGLLLSKVSRGRELGIRVDVDRRSGLRQFPPRLDRHDFVLLLGNLIENAFDALEDSGRTDKEVYISIEQDDEVLSVLVEDNGCGMDKKTRERMLEKGFSTKSTEGRGIGLFLVNRILTKGGGELKCESQKNVGTSMIVMFSMQGQNGDRRTV
ncbi:ATP-binding protein [Paenibacillus chitinolyticus]|uniref:ATP-binding protein n=1 Tax=Paenibacillus chitinolyticus TaxID=79263 RepID=UPI00386C088B